MRVTVEREKSLRMSNEEQVTRLRVLAARRAQKGTPEALEESIYLSGEADELVFKQIQRKVIADYLKTGSQTPTNELERKALNSLQDPSGGFLIRAILPAEILAKGLSDYNPIRDYATVVTLEAGDLYPWPRETTRPGTRWVRETDSRQTPTSDMVLAGEGIPAHILNATVPVSSKLRDDATYDPDIFVIQPVMRSFLVSESTAFVVGSGIGQPEGLFTNGAVSVVHSGSSSTITADSIRAMFYTLPAAFRKNSYWMMNDATIEVVKTLKDSSGAYLYDRGIFGLAPETLMGRPIVSCPDAPAIAGSANPLMLGDLSRYVIVDRTPLAVLVDPFSAKPSVVHDCVRRVGAQVVDPTAFVKMLIAT